MLSSLAEHSFAEDVIKRLHEEQLARLKHEHAMSLHELTREQHRLLQKIDALASCSNNTELAVVGDSSCFSLSYFVIV